MTRDAVIMMRPSSAAKVDGQSLRDIDKDIELESLYHRHLLRDHVVACTAVAILPLRRVSVDSCRVR
jgi:hypothetical protein